MYISGAVTGYILGLFVFYFRAKTEPQLKEYLPLRLLVAVIGSFIPAILSWFGVFVLVAYILSVIQGINENKR